MSGERMLNASERWLRLLLHLYPADIREEMERHSSRRIATAAVRRYGRAEPYRYAWSGCAHWPIRWSTASPSGPGRRSPASRESSLPRAATGVNARMPGCSSG
ncbi:MAG: hypothetical protein ACR2HZ_09430 [Gemmatimonadaceae bacterium]